MASGDSENSDEGWDALRKSLRKSLRDFDQLEHERNVAEERESLERQQDERAGQHGGGQSGGGDGDGDGGAGSGGHEEPGDHMTGNPTLEETENALVKNEDDEIDIKEEEGYLDDDVYPDEDFDGLNGMNGMINKFASYRGDGMRDKFLTTYVTPVASKDHPKMGRWASETYWPRIGRPGHNDPRTAKLEREFLKQDYRPDKDARHWEGKKVIGRGGMGIVGLWECVDSETGHKSQMAVKETTYESLKRERDIMVDLKGRGHCVQLIGPMPYMGEGDDDLEAIMMEFCEGGSLAGRIQMAMDSKTPFEERVIWRIFDCLIKGLNVMDHGTEAKLSDVASPDSLQALDSWWPITHFDIKPQNILVTTLDEEHDIYPMCKIADFGFADRLRDIEDQLDSPVDRYEFRQHGTWGHYAPEQFSLRWQYDDWETNRELTFGTHTNIWQVGIIMYQCCTFRGPPQPKGFRCENIPGLTYGPGLRDTPYSEALKNLIWMCLTEKPSNRASLEYCSTRVEQALTTLDNVPRGALTSQEELTDPEPSPSHSVSKAKISGGSQVSSASSSIKIAEFEEDGLGQNIYGGNTSSTDEGEADVEKAGDKRKRGDEDSGDGLDQPPSGKRRRVGVFTV